MVDLTTQKQIANIDNRCIDNINENSPLISSLTDRHSPLDYQYTVDDAIDSIGFGFFHIRLMLFTAFIWIANSFEVMLIALLSPAVACQWSLSSEKETLITTVVFVGIGVGSFWGLSCDKYGRLKILFVSSFFAAYFSIMTAFVPVYEWLLVVRFLVGIFLSTSPISITYYSEFLPIRYRSPCIIILVFAFTTGTLMEIVLALFVIPTLGWRYLVFFSTVPMLLLLFLFPFVPTSPRFLVSVNKMSEAEDVLRLCAKQNCKSLPNGTLVAHKANSDTSQYDSISNSNNLHEERHKDVSKSTSYYDNSYSFDGQTNQINNTNTTGDKRESKSWYAFELFSKKYCLTTIYLLYIWFAGGFVYYGTVLISTMLFEYDHHCDASININMTINATGNTTMCKQLSQSDYIEFLISSAAEFPGTILTLILSDIIGRKLTMSSELFISAIGFMLLFFCYGTNAKLYKTIFLFAIRGGITGAFQAAYVYTPEAYPTHIRATALSLCSASARIGSIITPFIAQMLLKTNFIAAIMVYGGCAALAAVICLLLPVETKGKRLEDIEKEFEVRVSKKWSLAAIFMPSFDIFTKSK